MTDTTNPIHSSLAAYVMGGPERLAEVALARLALAGTIDLGADLRRVGDARGVRWTSAPTAQQLGVVPTVRVAAPLAGDADPLDVAVHQLVAAEPGMSVSRLLDTVPALEPALDVLTEAARRGWTKPGSDRRTRAGKQIAKTLQRTHPLFSAGHDDLVMALAVRGPVVFVRSDRPELATALTSRPSASSTRSA